MWNASIFCELKKWILLLSNCLESGGSGGGKFSKKLAGAAIQVSTLCIMPLYLDFLHYKSCKIYQGIRTAYNEELFSDNSDYMSLFG